MQSMTELEKIFNEFEKQLPQGYVADSHNVALLHKYIQDHKNGIYSLAGLNEGTHWASKQPGWIWSQPPVVKSPEEQDYDNISSNLTKHELSIFYNWYNTRSKLSKTEPESWINKVLVLKAATGYPVTYETYTLVLSRLFTSSKQRLYTEDTQEWSNPKSHAGRGEKFNQYDTTNQNSAEGKKNHANNPAFKPSTPAFAESENAQLWTKLADDIQGSTHAETAALKNIVGNSPRETYRLRLRASKQVHG